MAMSRMRDSDLLRINELEGWGWRVISCSEAGPDVIGEHISTRFETSKIDLLVDLVKHMALLHEKVIVALDYFFCPKKYFESNYGLHWWAKETGTVSRLLKAGASEVFLPQTEETKQYSEVKGTLRGTGVQWHDNPLWRATEKVNLPADRGGHLTQMKYCVLPFPFLRFTSALQQAPTPVAATSNLFRIATVEEAKDSLCHDSVSSKPVASCPFPANKNYRAPFTLNSKSSDTKTAEPEAPYIARQGCALCTAMVKIPTSRQNRIYRVLFEQLLQWTPEPLPVICMDCWGKQHPAAHTQMKQDDRYRKMFGQSKGFFCLAHIPSASANSRLDEELCRRGFRTQDVLHFSRELPAKWWQTLSFAHVAPLCVPFERFSAFCRSVLSLSPNFSLKSITAEVGPDQSTAFKRQVAKGVHGHMRWLNPDGTILKDGKFTQMDCELAVQQWNSTTERRGPDETLSIDQCPRAVFPLTVKMLSERKSEHRSSTRRTESDQMVRISVPDTHKPAYFSLSCAHQRMCITDVRFDVPHRDVVLACGLVQSGDTKTFLDYRIGTTGNSAVHSAIQMGIRKNTRVKAKKNQVTAQTASLNLGKRRKRKLDPSLGERRECNGIANDVASLRSETRSLLSFNVWCGGILPLDQPQSADCYARSILNHECEHPANCPCSLREFVLVGAFHVVQMRHPYTIPRRRPEGGNVLVAGFHSIHTIGPQVAVSAPMSGPIPVHDVSLAVAYAHMLQQNGITATDGPVSAMDTLNLPLLLYFLREQGQPQSVLGAHVEAVLVVREQALKAWEKAEAKRPDPKRNAKDLVCIFTKCKPETPLLISKNRRFSHKGMYSTTTCDHCERVAYLGFVHSDGMTRCLRCDTAMNSEIQIPNTPAAVWDSRMIGTASASPKQLSDLQLQAFRDFGVVVVKNACDGSQQHVDVEAIADSFAKQLLNDELVFIFRGAVSSEFSKRPTILHRPWQNTRVNTTPDLIVLLCVSQASSRDSTNFYYKSGSHRSFPTLASTYPDLLPSNSIRKNDTIRFSNSNHDWCSGMQAMSVELGDLVLWDSRSVVQLPSNSYPVACFRAFRASQPETAFSLQKWLADNRSSPVAPIDEGKQLPIGVFEEPAPRVHLHSGPWTRYPARLERFFSGNLHYIVGCFKRSSCQQPQNEIAKETPSRSLLKIDQIYLQHQQQLCRGTTDMARGIRADYERVLKKMLEANATTSEACKASTTSKDETSDSPSDSSGKDEAPVAPCDNQAVRPFKVHCCFLSLCHFVRPCCIPLHDTFCHTILLMGEIFKENLIGKGPPKTQTLRIWQPEYAKHHKAACHAGHWVRVWRGQGHMFTIGWAKYTSIKPFRLGNLDAAGCRREGRPAMSPGSFLKKFLLRKKRAKRPGRFSSSGRYYPPKPECPAVTKNTIALEIRFLFLPCVL
jgi:hypothetical protein